MGFTYNTAMQLVKTKIKRKLLAPVKQTEFRAENKIKTKKREGIQLQEVVILDGRQKLEM